MSRLGKEIYAISANANLTKIGIAASSAIRLRALQTASPSALALVYAAYVDGDALVLERRVHKDLQRHRKSGEWFSVSEAEAIAAIRRAADALGVELLAPGEWPQAPVTVATKAKTVPQTQEGFAFPGVAGTFHATGWAPPDRPLSYEEWANVGKFIAGLYARKRAR
jgi:hypothetical protein